MTGASVGGVLLTGGTSSRLGRDKARLEFRGETLAARTARALVAVCLEVVEVGPGRSGLRAVREDPPGAGPLAALVAGADALDPRHGVLLLACDLPGVDAALLAELRDDPAPGTLVPEADGRLQYTCARYAPDAMATARALLHAGERSLRALVAEIPFTVWVAPDPDRFADIDTADDMERWGIGGGR